MAVDDRGERNRPIYAGAGAPSDAEDLTYLGELISELGTRRAGTAAERQALGNEWLFDGLEWYETDTGVVYRIVAGVWTLGGSGSTRLRMQRPGAAGIQATSWTAVGMTSSAQEGSGGFGGGGGSFTVPVTGRYGVSLHASAPATPSPNRRIIGICPAASVGSPVLQSPGFPSSGDSVTIDHFSEVTLQAGTAYVVGTYTTAPLNFTGYDVSVRLIAPTSIG